MLSIVICTFNRGVRLGELCATLIEQQEADFELLVVDDGSTDDTRDVVGRLVDPRIRYVYQTNGGLSVARNTGLHEARGEVVAFVDDDDHPLPTWSSRLAAPFVDDECAVVSCGVIDVKGDIEVTRLPTNLGPVFDDYDGLIAAGSFAVQRHAALEAGGFDEDLHCNHQTEFMLRLLPLCSRRKWKVVAIDEALLRINWAAPTDRSRNNPERLLACAERLLDLHSERLRRDKTAYPNYAAVCGVCCARLGRYREARAWFVDAWRSSHSKSHATRAVITLFPPLARRLWSTA